jgi:uncharacterized protein YjbI with pentapeptide repeats
MTQTPLSRPPLSISIEQITAALTAGQAELYDFYKANLTDIDLAGADLTQIKWINTTLKRAKLMGTILREADLRGADLTDADLSGADLSSAGLTRANLCGANLSQAVLAAARLTLARYNQVTQWPEGFDYKRCGAIGPAAQVGGAFLNAVNLRHADLTNLNALGAYLAGADFSGANLTGARLSSADVKRAFFTGACLRGASLNNVDLVGCDFQAADLTEASLENLQGIQGADFGQTLMSTGLRAKLLARPAAELDVRNSFTRRTTRESLNMAILRE